MKGIEMKLKKEDFIQLGFSPYHYVQYGDYVTVGDDDSDGFRKIQGASGPVREYTYPIYRLDTDKLLSRIDKLDKECEKLTEVLNGLYDSGIDLQEHEHILRNALGLEDISDRTASS